MENVKLALEINRMIHNECKDVPHDIGARIMQLIEKDYDVKLILPVVVKSVKEKEENPFWYRNTSKECSNYDPPKKTWTGFRD